MGEGEEEKKKGIVYGINFLILTFIHYLVVAIVIFFYSLAFLHIYLLLRASAIVKINLLLFI
jgi:hypothetical protein